MRVDEEINWIFVDDEVLLLYLFLVDNNYREINIGRDKWKLFLSELLF